jgi:hypothetical protein
MLDLADLKARLEAQLAAVAEAEQAIARVHALCGLPLPVERVEGLTAPPPPADPSEPASAAVGTTAGAAVAAGAGAAGKGACRECGKWFEPARPSLVGPDCGSDDPGARTRGAAGGRAMAPRVFNDRRYHGAVDVLPGRSSGRKGGGGLG